MYAEHTVAVVIPAYNEEGFVGEVIETIPSFVDRVYVVDDCSTDGTWDEIKRHAAEYPSILDDDHATEDEPDENPPSADPPSAVADGGSRTTVVPIQHDENSGVGRAITTGYERALEDEIDVTAVMAGDGQMDPDQLDRLLEPIIDGDAEYAKGNRLGERDYSQEMSSWRLFGNLTLTFLTKVSSGYWGMMDPQNGYTAISKTALERIDLESLYERYGFTNDLLVELNTRQLRIADVAMPAVYGDEESHIEYRSFVPNLSWLLLRRFGRRLRIRYMLTDFHPLAFMYLVGIVGVGVTLTALGTALSTRANADSRASTALSGSVLALVSVVTLLLAMTFDRDENDDMVVTVR